MIIDWIPCSERLPENETDCIVTLRGRFESYVTADVFVDGLFKAASMYGLKVIAWVPSPEPYEEKNDEN